MSVRDVMDLLLPHLAGEEDEFVHLADRNLVCDGVNIPMHTLILARESRVLAQLFSSLEEAGRGDRQLGEIFAGEKLKTVLLVLYLLYNCNHAAVKDAMKHGVRGASSRPGYVLSSAPTDPSLWQAVVGLAHKLDTRRLLATIESLIVGDSFVSGDCFILGSLKEQLSWVRFASRTPLTSLRANVLLSLGRTLLSHANDTVEGSQMNAVAEALELPVWEELDKQTLIMVIESLTYNIWSQRNRVATARDEAYREWATPGGLLARAISGTNETAGNADPLAGAGEHGDGDIALDPLQQLEQLNELQVAEDWGHEWEAGEAEQGHGDA